MNLVDRTPGGFIALVALVVYAVAGLEAGTLLIDSSLIMAVTLLLIAACAGLICVFMAHLMADDSGSAEDATIDVETMAAPSEPTVAPTPRRAARATRTAHVA